MYVCNQFIMNPRSGQVSFFNRDFIFRRKNEFEMIGEKNIVKRSWECAIIECTGTFGKALFVNI